jgi:hypothetical protein
MQVVLSPSDSPICYTLQIVSVSSGRNIFGYQAIT